MQHEFIRQHPLGLIVSHGGSGLTANLAPFLLAPDGAHGILRAHLARANPQWRELASGQECLVVFQHSGAYITPNWYATKQETGKVVPTWNYAIVQAWGVPRVIEDPGWLRTLVGELTRTHEAAQPRPWKIEDAPADYVDTQLKAIVGLEIPIARIEGKWKMSQNRPEADRARVADGLTAQGGAPAQVGAWVKDRMSS